MRTLFLAATMAVLAACATHSEKPTPRVTPADLVRVSGEGWTGTLVYRDYSPPFGEVTLKTDVDISMTTDGLMLAMRYPDEPSANSTDILSVGAGGTKLGGDPVISRRKDGKTVYFTTRADCDDDGTPATCEHVYTFGKKQFGMRKTVTFKDGSASFQRNAYTYTR